MKKIWEFYKTASPYIIIVYAVLHYNFISINF